MFVKTEAVFAPPNVYMNIWRSKYSFCEVYNTQSDVAFSIIKSTDVSSFTQLFLTGASGIGNDIRSIYTYDICLFEKTIL